MTFKLITDSTADLDEGWASAHNVEILGLTVQLDGKTCGTVDESRLTSGVLLESIKNGGRPIASRVSAGQFEENFRRHAQSGDKVLYLALSSVLSGTYQSSMIARDIVLKELLQATVEIVDTLAVTGGKGYSSVLVAQACDEGKSLEETKAMIIDILSRLRAYSLVDDLYHLMREGRLSETSAIMGGLASIKPLLWIEPSGELVPLAKVRGCRKVLKEVVSQATQSLAHDTAAVAYANDIEGAETLKRSLLEHEDVDHILIMSLGPVISTHAGPGTLAVLSIGKGAR